MHVPTNREKSRVFPHTCSFIFKSNGNLFSACKLYTFYTIYFLCFSNVTCAVFAHVRSIILSFSPFKAGGYFSNIRWFCNIIWCFFYTRFTSYSHDAFILRSFITYSRISHTSVSDFSFLIECTRFKLTLNSTQTERLASDLKGFKLTTLQGLIHDPKRL